MIFQKEHIKQIKNGIKTQTRRVNRGKYQIGKDYAVQLCRTCKGIKGMRIVMDKIYRERFDFVFGHIVSEISKEDAKAEDNYTPKVFEKKFRELNPKWDGISRWVFVFHLKERVINESFLSKDMKVAIEILQGINTLSKLDDKMKMPRDEIKKAIQILRDLGVIYEDYKKTDKGWVKFFRVSRESRVYINDILKLVKQGQRIEGD